MARITLAGDILEALQCPDCAGSLTQVDVHLVCNSCGSRHSCGADALGGPLLYLLPRLLREVYHERNSRGDSRTIQPTKVTELHYRQHVAYTETVKEGALISTKTRTHLDWNGYMVETYFPLQGEKGRGLRILEIGAGYCGTLAHARRLLRSQVPSYALDISDVLMGQVAPHAIRHIGIDNSSVVKIVGDFEALPFSDGAFDLVICDAALHHAEDLSTVVRECRRILRPDGWLYIQREPTLSILRSREQKRRQEQIADRLEGAVEKIYSLPEWKASLNAAGFCRIDVVPVGRLPLHKMRRLRALARLYNTVFDKKIWRHWKLLQIIHFWVNRLVVPTFVMMGR